MHQCDRAPTCISERPAMSRDFLSICARQAGKELLCTATTTFVPAVAQTKARRAIDVLALNWGRHASGLDLAAWPCLCDSCTFWIKPWAFRALGLSALGRFTRNEVCRLTKSRFLVKEVVASLHTCRLGRRHCCADSFRAGLEAGHKCDECASSRPGLLRRHGGKPRRCGCVPTDAGGTSSSCRPICSGPLAPLSPGVGILGARLRHCLLGVLGADETLQRARELPGREAGRRLRRIPSFPTCERRFVSHFCFIFVSALLPTSMFVLFGGGRGLGLQGRRVQEEGFVEKVGGGEPAWEMVISRLLRPNLQHVLGISLQLLDGLPGSCSHVAFNRFQQAYAEMVVLSFQCPKSPRSFRSFFPGRPWVPSFLSASCLS